MADFKDHINALTGLGISSSGTTPLDVELSEFLKDGIKDVINKVIKARPDELPKFCKTTNSTSSITLTGKILSVTREHDSTSILRKCTKISPDLRYLATDVDSIYYRSKYNPAYYELDGLIYSVPAAGSGNNDLVVTQVHYDIGIAHSDTYNNTGSNIENFPTEYEYLVAIYAAIKSLEAKMADFAIEEEDGELVQAITVNLNSLKQEYAGAFASMAPPQPQQAGGR